MKYLLALVLVLSAGSAWAGEGVVSQCRDAFPAAEDRQERLACIQTLSSQAVAQQLQQMQAETARQQANGLALFDSGPALIHGMNQGFQQMQVHPYVLPPAQQYPTR